MKTYSFESLKAWQTSKELAKTVYKITKNFPADERYGLTSQIRRSAVSVPTNIAEGSGRITGKDKAHFSTQSYSSLMEVLNHAIIAQELGYMSQEQLKDLRTQVNQVAPLLSGLRTAQLKQSS
jgi:four helix bundle protein